MLARHLDKVPLTTGEPVFNAKSHLSLGLSLKFFPPMSFIVVFHDDSCSFRSREVISVLLLLTDKHGVQALAHPFTTIKQNWTCSTIFLLFILFLNPSRPNFFSGCRNQLFKFEICLLFA